MKKIILPIIALFLLSYNAFPNDFYTTRLMSTAGAGVGAVLLNESTVLNPASAAYFKNGSFYYQNYEAELQDANNQRQTDQNLYPNPKEGKLFIVTDTSSAIKGGLSYMTYNDTNFNRKRYNLSFAKAINPKSTFGVIYKNTSDDLKNGTRREFHQATFGMTHVVSENFTMGAIIVDPFKAYEDEGKIIFGTQYIVSNRFFILFDFGGNYHKTISDTAEWHLAAQVLFLEDFMVRFGLFENKALGTKGDGVGASWAGPKLSLDFAIMNSKPSDETTSILYKDESLVETSLTVSLKI